MITKYCRPWDVLTRLPGISALNLHSIFVEITIMWPMSFDNFQARSTAVDLTGSRFGSM